MSSFLLVTTTLSITTNNQVPVFDYTLDILKRAIVHATQGNKINTYLTMPVIEGVAQHLLHSDLACYLGLNVMGNFSEIKAYVKNICSNNTLFFSYLTSCNDWSNDLRQHHLGAHKFSGLCHEVRVTRHSRHAYYFVCAAVVIHDNCAVIFAILFVALPFKIYICCY